MERKTYLIPRNHTSFFTVGEMIKGKNLIEAFIATVLLCKLLSMIPFVSAIKIGITVVCGGACFFVFLIGYNDESIIGFLQGYIKHKATSGIRRIQIPKQEETPIPEKEERQESYVEKFIKRFVRRKD